MNIFHIFWQSGLIVKLVLLLLVGLSVACWAIIVFKHKELKRFQEQNPQIFFKGIKGRETRRKVERVVEEEMERLERYIPFLATTGSSAPFIGLFGTVWGIMSALWQMGRAGSTSLAVVGPYLGEALIATAFGLAAAIPAVIFYNHFVGKIRILSRNIASAGEDLIHQFGDE